jgi:hypothetical protein
MKKVMVSLKAEVDYSVIVTVPDTATDAEILHEAETNADHHNDVIDFNWRKNGSWNFGNHPAYEIEDYED